MLVLSRREGETIRIGRDIVIHFSRIRGNRVSIGIDAPDSERILRGEIGDFQDEVTSQPLLDPDWQQFPSR